MFFSPVNLCQRSRIKSVNHLLEELKIIWVFVFVYFLLCSLTPLPIVGSNKVSFHCGDGGILSERILGDVPVERAFTA